MPASPSLTPSQEPPASSGHVARVSLRLRVLALVAAANVVVFGAGLAHLSTLLRDAEEQAEREYWSAAGTRSRARSTSAASCAWRRS